jgi:hypothetical protein
MPNRSSEPDLFLSSVREPSSSSPSSRHVLPTNLDTAIKHLDDQELERLLLAALEERTRRKIPPVAEDTQRRRRAEGTAVSVPQGKLNAVRAAFKAGVTPSRIARQFGLSRSDVSKVLAGGAKNQ